MDVVGPEVRQFVEMLVGLASPVGWQEAARAIREGDELVVALRVHPRSIEMADCESKRRLAGRR